MRIIANTDQSARDAQIAKEIEAALKNGNKALLWVPEQYTLESERWACRAFKGVPRIDFEVVSFNRLAHRYVDGRRGNTRKTLGSSGQLMALQRLILKNRDQLASYGRIAGKTSFALEMAALIKELKLSGVGSEALNDAGRWLDVPLMLTAKIQDIARIFSAYEAWSETGFMDETDRLKLMASVLDEEEPFRNCSIWFHGFRNFTQVEWNVLHVVHRQARAFTFALGIPDLQSSEKVYRPLIKTIDHLQRISSKEGAISWVSEPASQSATLRDAIFVGEFAGSVPPVPQVACSRCGNPHHEIERAALKILEWVRLNNWKWKDIMVVTPSDREWQLALARIFSRYEIPCHADTKVPLSDQALSRYVLTMLEAVESGMDGETVCRGLKWGYSGIGKEQIENLENHVLARGIRGKRWGNHGEAPPGVSEAMAWVDEVIGDFKDALKAQKNADGRSDALIAFLEKTGVPAILALEQDGLAQSGNLREAQVQGQVWESVMDVIAQVRTLLNEETMDLGDYIAILRAGLESEEIGVIPPTADQVLTGTLFRSRSSHVKGLVVLGANEGQLPSYDSGDGLLLNDEKLILIQRGLALESDRDTRGQEEEYALYELLGKAEETLYVSCSRKSSTGEPLHPSWFYDAVEKFSHVGARGDGAKDAPIPPPAFLYKMAELRREGIPLSGINGQRAERLRNVSNWRDKVSVLEAGAAHRYQVAPLNKNHVDGLTGKSLIVSPTGLERYARCPFSWLVKHGLRPMERKTYAVAIPDMGMLFHAAVDGFVRAYGSESWEHWSASEVERALEPVVQAIASGYGHGVLDDNARNRFLKTKVKRLTLRALTALGMHLNAGDFEVVGTEVPFEINPEKSGFPPLVLQTEGGENIVVHGRIDRIDACRVSGEMGEETYLRVIDYKSGRPKFSLSDFSHGLELQLAIYLDVANRNGSRYAHGNIRPAGFLYFYLDDPLVDPAEDTPSALERAIFRELRMEGVLIEDMKVLNAMDHQLSEQRNSSVIPVSLKQNGEVTSASSVVPEKVMTAILRYVEEHIRKQGTAIKSGCFPVSPCQTEKGMACDYCDYKALCQYDPSSEEEQRRVLRKLSGEKALEIIAGGIADEPEMDR